MPAVKRLIIAYVLLCLAAVAGIVALRDDPALVTPAVWGRGTLAAASAVLIGAFTLRAARGSRPAFRRLRIASAIVLIAIAVIVALPGGFPAWFRVEQGLS